MLSQSFYRYSKNGQHRLAMPDRLSAAVMARHAVMENTDFHLFRLISMA
jgi:hypothetical protein